MFLWLADYLEQYYRAFAVVQYLSLRSIFAALSSFCLGLGIGPLLIARLTQYKVGQMVRDDGPQTHLGKSGTPTMGGVLVLLAITVSMLLWGDLTNHYVWVVLLVTLGFGLIGFSDDYRKLILKNSKGLPARWKYFWQSLIAITVAIYLYSTASLPSQTELVVPFFKECSLATGIIIYPADLFRISGSE